MNLSKIKNVLRRSKFAERSRLRILSELIVWKYIKKSDPYYYFYYNFDSKASKEYLNNKEFENYEWSLHQESYFLLEDKFRFLKFMKGLRVPIAENIGVVNKNFYDLKKKRSFPLEELLEREIDCILKKNTGWGGSGVYEFKTESGAAYLNNEKIELENLKRLDPNFILLQKRITQNEKISAFNFSSINTVRMITIHDGRKSNYFLSHLRIGRENSYRDNWAQNGIIVGIDSDGVLEDEAFLKENNFLKKIKVHPDSGIAFKEKEIPFFKMIKKELLEVHTNFLPDFFSIGWDIAITPTGFKIIEANSPWSLGPFQIIFGGIKRKYLDYWKKYKEMRRL